jgi:rod shape-determining protein MreC
MVKRDTLARSEKNIFSNAPPYLAHFLFILFLTIIIVIMDYKYKKLEPVRTWINTALYPVYFLADLPMLVSNWVDNTLVSKGNLLEDKNNLHNENLLLQQRLQKYEMLEVENKRLRSLLNMSKLYIHDKVQIAGVLRLDHSKSQNELTLDKGSKDGVYIGQPVLDAKGLLGHIVHVSYLTSKLLLVDSTRHYTPVQVVRNSYRTIAAGTGPLQPLQLQRIPESADIVEGDIMITSGMGGVFPAGYKVGVVKEITPNEDHFLQVKVETFAHSHKVEEALLIWPANRDFQSSIVSDYPENGVGSND